MCCVCVVVWVLQKLEVDGKKPTSDDILTKSVAEG